MAFRKPPRFYWSLTDKALIQGEDNTRVFPLSSITKIVIGAPEPSKLERFFIGFDNSGLAAAQYNYSMVLKFDNGEILRLFLLMNQGGQELMEALCDRCSSLVDQTYKFTPEESRVLNVYRFPSSMNRVFFIGAQKH